MIIGRGLPDTRARAHKIEMAYICFSPDESSLLGTKREWLSFTDTWNVVGLILIDRLMRFLESRLKHRVTSASTSLIFFVTSASLNSTRALWTLAAFSSEARCKLVDASALTVF